MKALFVLLAVFVCFGIVVRDFNMRTRLLVLFVVACMVAYITLG